MNGWRIYLVAVLCLSAAATVLMVGKPRKVITPELAFWSLVISATLVLAALKA